MEKKDFPPPIMISECEGKIHISYGQVSVDIPAVGPVPLETPPLARRVFEVFARDLPDHLRAE